jgi:DNA repair photolyase
MKKDISKSKFGSIVGWRGDSLVCPQAFGGDVYSGCSMECWWCFCREMEEELFTKYYTGWRRDLVRPCDPDDYKKLFDKAFGSDKEYSDWSVSCLRYGLPFNMGSKAETFCREDIDQGSDSVAIKVLELFKEYQVPVLFQTKSHYVGLHRYLDLIKDLNCAVIVSVMGGSDTLNYDLEPGSPCASARWYLIKELTKLNLWTAARWEPIMPGINSQPDVLESYAKSAKESGARHVSWYNYRTSNARKAQQEFESRGYNYIKMLERNLDDEWKPVGDLFIGFLNQQGVPQSSPDFVNFTFTNDRESCCGTDELFKPYQFTFQHACRLILKQGYVCWEDMENIPFREPKAYERMKSVWNGGGQYFSLKDSKDIIILDKDKKGFNIYGKRDSAKGPIKPKKRGFGVFQ